MYTNLLTDLVDELLRRRGAETVREVDAVGPTTRESADVVIVRVGEGDAEEAASHETMSRAFASCRNTVVLAGLAGPDGATPDWVSHARRWVGRWRLDFAETETRTGPGEHAVLFVRLPAARHTLPGELTVSLTSYPGRFGILELTLRRILQQSVLADRTVLWIAHDDLALLPPGVLDLEHEGLTIATTEDLGPYKKIIPALRQYPDSFILTLDDDLDYPRDTLEPLVSGYRSPDEVLCRRCHRIRVDRRRRILPYDDWEPGYRGLDARTDLVALGACGILYPPHIFTADVTDIETFMRLAPHADDLWLYWMARRSGHRIRNAAPLPFPVTWPGTDAQGLWATANQGGGNDRQVRALIDAFGRTDGATPDSLSTRLSVTAARIERFGFRGWLRSLLETTRKPNLL